MSDQPTLNPPEFEPFFANVRAGRLAFPRCGACRRFHWYPMPRCPHCRSAAIEWTTIGGTAELFSFTEVRHAFDKSRRDRLPYVVGLVTFPDADGVRLVTNIVDAEAAALRIGDRLEPVFDAEEDGVPLVLFRPARKV